MNAKSVKEVWETEEIRVLILISLLIQALLTFVAPYRKNVAKASLEAVLWVLYLLADVIAMYIIGLISNNRCHHYAESSELLTLWAPFLLVHLGGPDTITALALEDNELWRRHALQLITQVSVTLLVFCRSLRESNRLWIPSLLMFIVGFVKYFERTRTLWSASRDKFKDSMMTPPEAGPNFARLMDEYISASYAHIPVDFVDTGDVPLDSQNRSTAQVHVSETKDLNDKLVLYAHWFYDKFKPFLAEELLSIEDRDACRKFFLEQINVEEGSRIIQIELNLIYDTFYTKSFSVWTKRLSTRLLCFVLVVASLLLFCLTWDLRKHKTDAIITFILFFGAIALDLSAAIMFLSSDWRVILTYEKNNQRSFRSWLTHRILRWPRWAVPKRRERCRWSQTISQYNFLRYCFIRERPYILSLSDKFAGKHVSDIIIRFYYVRVKKIDDDQLMSFIIEEIRKKAVVASDIEGAKKAYSARGNMVLEDHYGLSYELLSPWILDHDYDESLMIWHLATDICYWKTSKSESNHTSVMEEKCREFSKQLSDYMLYLVIWQQSLLSSVVGRSKVRFQDTCAAAHKFMDNTQLSISDSRKEQVFFSYLSERLLKNSQVLTHIANLEKADKSNSVLFDACRLANQLMMFDNQQWEITSKVWVELLCYAAARCSPRYHIAQLSKGGELITFVWFLMAHLGLGERFLQHKGYGWTRLVIDI